MRVYFLVLSLIVFSSCAILKDAKNNFIGFNYSEIFIGEPILVALEKRGYPEHQLKLENESLYLYKDGFIYVKNEIVSNRGSYSYFLQEGDLLSANVIKGEDLFRIIPRLGLPLSIEDRKGRTIIRYNRGIILAEGPKVLASIDKMYENLVFDLDINAFADNSAQETGAYYIMPGSDRIGPEDFQFKEIKSYILASLKMQGYRTTNSFQSAKYVVFVNYGISDPKEDIKVISRPIYIPNYIPGRSVNFYGSSGNYIGSARTSGSWSTEYAGQHTETVKTVTYSRWLNIEAVDYDYLVKTKSLKPVWKVLVNSVGYSGDLRFVLPALSYGAVSYVNQDTQRELSFSVSSQTLNQYVYDVKLSNTAARSLAGKK